jgi:hypothetical protein
MLTRLLAGLAVVACLLVVALSSCSKDPKSLTDSGSAHLGKGEYESALSDFEDALREIGGETGTELYRRAAIGKFQALARIDPKRARAEFVELAKARSGKFVEGDFTAVAHALMSGKTSEGRMEAVELVKAAHAAFPESPKLHAIGEAVLAEATRTNDPAAIEAINSLGYGGGGKR